MLAWVGCIAGALDEDDYRAKLAAAGFEAIGVEPTRVYKVEDAREFLTSKGIDVDALRQTGRRQVHERLRPRDQAAGGGEGGVLRAELLRLKPPCTATSCGMAHMRFAA